MNKGTRIVALVIVGLLVFSLLASLVVPFWRKIHEKTAGAQRMQSEVDRISTAAYFKISLTLQKKVLK